MFWVNSKALNVLVDHTVSDTSSLALHSIVSFILRLIKIRFIYSKWLKTLNQWFRRTRRITLRVAPIRVSRSPVRQTRPLRQPIVWRKTKLGKLNQQEYVNFEDFRYHFNDDCLLADRDKAFAANYDLRRVFGSNISDRGTQRLLLLQAWHEFRQLLILSGLH